MAIFGGSGQGDVLEAAQCLGYEVARQACVVLTGASGPATGAVKGEAIRGADRAAGETHLAPWVGVPKQGDKRASGTIDPARSFVVDAPYDDRRNYLEAFMCDVAIALPGSDGTRSEVAFCLALGRPVLLASPEWEALWPVKKDSADREAFLDAATSRVSRSDDGVPATGIQALIDKAYEVLDAYDSVGGGTPTYECVSMPDARDAADVVALSRRLAGTPSARPFLDLPELKDEAERFAGWYRKVQDHLASPGPPA